LYVNSDIQKYTVKVSVKSGFIKPINQHYFMSVNTSI